MELDFSSFEGFADEIKMIKSDTHYWLVRCMGGDFFSEYTSRGYIAIGYNEVSLAEIKHATSYNEKAGEQLKLMIEAKEMKKVEPDDDINPQYASTQLLKFYRDINIGDIIVIPGKNSDFVAIAKIESDVYEEKKVAQLTGVCNFIKRRKIKVLRTLFRSKLNPKMLLMFNSRHIISNADNYAEFIDNCVSDFYQKDDTTFLVLRVRQEESLRGIDFGLVPELISLLKDYSEENNLNLDPVNDIKAKMCVQSPGDILMFATSWEGITIIGLFLVVLAGGEVYCNKTEGFKFKAGTIFSSISEFLDRRRDRKFIAAMQDKLKGMKIETPEDLTKIMEEFNKKRNKY